MSKRKRPKFAPGQLCYLCNERLAVTEDHVPPEGFFPRGYPKGHKLPACNECNGSFAKDDDHCRLLLCFGGFNDVAAQVFNDQIFRSLTRPYELLKRVPTIDVLKQKMGPRDLVSESGVYLGTRTALNFSLDDSKRLDRLVARVTCGLHYQHFDSALPLDYHISVYFKPPQNVLESFLPRLPIRGQHGKVLTYLGGEPPCSHDDPDHFIALWFMLFYGTLHFAAFVSSPGGRASHQTPHEYNNPGGPLALVLQLPQSSSPVNLAS